ncbi:MAG: SURF1 family protein [Betaproteobacteria bacterium]|nr:SURF1 family protein [Betaproteobacteria bacterium]
MRRRGFKPSLVTSLAAAAGLAATLVLGNWQLDRAHEKEAMAARLESLEQEPAITLAVDEVKAEDILWRRVTVRGRFEPRYAVFLDNRVRHGVAGYHVIMPLAIGGGQRYVLVNRGWIAGTRERAHLPSVRTPAGPVEVAGLAVAPSRRFLELSTRVADGRVWQNLTLERYRQAVPIALQPVLIRQQSPIDDGLVREWNSPDLGINTHYAYAFQWFALALAVLVFYLVTHVRRAA